MVATAGVILYCSGLLIALSNAQWIVKHSGLPSYNKQHPEGFLINLGWKSDDGEINNITLNLVKSDAVGRRIPLYSTDENGRAVQTSLLNLKHTTFYRDVTAQASVSLTSFYGEQFSVKGSFLAGQDKFDIEPYYPRIHKRSLGADKGDHIVTKRPKENPAELVDYLMPDKDSEDYKRLQIAWAKFDILEQRRSKDVIRMKRQSLPDTTYIVQLYMIADVYAYKTLTQLATDIGWSGSADDYIAFYLGHQASEVDARYRNIDSSVDPVFGSWTIGTKLSYLQIVKTNNDSTWTYPPDDAVNLYLDADTALGDLNTWVEAEAGLPADADHYMLITSLDLYSGGSLSVAGLAYVGGTCGSYKTSINELTSTTVYAHELGHNLGAGHDGSGNSCSGDDQNIMAASLGSTSESTRGNPWYFSNCSVTYFDTYISGLSTNCLTNNGSYVDTWADDSTSFPGQVLSLDEQCQLEYGDGYTTSASRFDEICYSLWCWTGSGSIYSSSAAFRYSSCGNKKWCVEEECVYDENAPELDESCPFGDSPGAIFTNSDEVCANVTGSSCSQSSHAQEFCCESCPALETPWLGPDCPYGDQAPGCATLSDSGCTAGSNGQTCCERCCETLGAAVGYSCEEPSTTTGPATTTSVTTVPTTTAPTTAALTTAAPTTAAPTTAAPTTAATTTAAPTTAAPTTAAPTTAAPTTAAPTTASPTTTAPTITSTTTRPTTTIAFRRGVRTRFFRLIIRITGFANDNFNCSDPNLQDSSSATYVRFLEILCKSFERHVRKIGSCEITGVSCGSIVVNSTIAVEQRDTDNSTEAAPANRDEFLQQISGILNDTELEVSETPVVEDINECEDATLNTCSDNAVCTNTDGFYTCECNKGYEDKSEYVDEPGRVCTEICDELCSTASIHLSSITTLVALAMALMYIYG